MINTCHKCKSISGVYYDLCDDCMTRFNKLEKEVEGLEFDLLEEHTKVVRYRKALEEIVILGRQHPDWGDECSKKATEALKEEV